MSRQHQRSHPGEPAAAGSSANPIVHDLPHDHQVNTNTTAEKLIRLPPLLNNEDGSYQPEESEEDSDPPRRFTKRPFRLSHPVDAEDDSRQAEESEEDFDQPQHSQGDCVHAHPSPSRKALLRQKKVKKIYHTHSQRDRSKIQTPSTPRLALIRQRKVKKKNMVEGSRLLKKT